MDHQNNDKTATKPQAENPVLAWDTSHWVRAMWVPKHCKTDVGDNDDWTDYCEADDTYYWPDGWYEVQTHGGDEVLWYIHPCVTAWQDMPPAPTVNAAAVPL